MKQIVSVVIVIVALITSPKNLIAAEGDSLRATAQHNQDGLLLHFFLIRDKSFFEKWAKPETPNIVSSDSYKRGEHVFPIIIFSTDANDEKGNANLTYDIIIYRPDGKVYGHFEQLLISKNEPSYFGRLYLFKQPIDIGLEEKDMLGIYRVHFTVFENVKNAKVNSELSFLVTE